MRASSLPRQSRRVRSRVSSRTGAADGRRVAAAAAAMAAAAADRTAYGAHDRCKSRGCCSSGGGGGGRDPLVLLAYTSVYHPSPPTYRPAIRCTLPRPRATATAAAVRFSQLFVSVPPPTRARAHPSARRTRKRIQPRSERVTANNINLTYNNTQE